MSNESETVLCRTPTPGKQPTRIPGWKFQALHDAILAVVPKDEKGIPFIKLAEMVEEYLPSEVRQDLGSIGWHTTTVKLEMEVRGEIERVPGASPQRLRQRP